MLIRKDDLHFYLAGIVVAIGVLAIMMFVMRNKDTKQDGMVEGVYTETVPEIIEPLARVNPLENVILYTNLDNNYTKLANEMADEGDSAITDKLTKVASQPVAIWLIGPNQSDPLADRDIETVVRTSKDAASKGAVPIYALYAIPNRDACERFSNGGFDNSEDYLVWLNRILGALQSRAVFSVEADAIGHTLRTDCLTAKEKAERYALLNNIMKTLSESPNVAATYLDAGHSEWFPDPEILVEPLKLSGVEKGSGIAVNVSNFIDTPTITTWSQSIIGLLGSELGVVIDTSRNGKGAPDKSVTGDLRWCNPSGRGLGNLPTTTTNAENIDAYLWIKIPGESDGQCYGYPSAGTFIESYALELARNSLE